MCDLIVVTRPGYELGGKVPSGAANLIDVRGMSRKKISALLDSSSVPGVFLTDAAMVDISASRVRAAVQSKGQSNARSNDWGTLKEMVPAPVASYIEKYKLYRN